MLAILLPPRKKTDTAWSSVHATVLRSTRKVDVFEFSSHGNEVYLCRYEYLAAQNRNKKNWHIISTLK